MKNIRVIGSSGPFESGAVEHCDGAGAELHGADIDMRSEFFAANYGAKTRRPFPGIHASRARASNPPVRRTPSDGFRTQL